MTDFLREYLLSIVAVSLLGTVTRAVLPKGTIANTLQFLCGLLLILVTISPIVSMDVGNLALPSMEMAPMETQVCDPNLAKQVAEECQAYVEKLAHTMGYTVEATVTVNQETPYPYPETIIVKGSLPQEMQTRLSQKIAKDLAIPENRQSWSSYKGEAYG